jgi:ABC-type transporter Mla subunit MlaD
LLYDRGLVARAAATAAAAIAATAAAVSTAAATATAAARATAEAATAAWATTAAATTAAATAHRALARFVHRQRPAVERMTVERFSRLACNIVAVEFDEAEATRLVGRAIDDHLR